MINSWEYSKTLIIHSKNLVANDNYYHLISVLNYGEEDQTMFAKKFFVKSMRGLHALSTGFSQFISASLPLSKLMGSSRLASGLSISFGVIKTAMTYFFQGKDVEKNLLGKEDKTSAEILDLDTHPSCCKKLTYYTLKWTMGAGMLCMSYLEVLFLILNITHYANEDEITQVSSTEIIISLIYFLLNDTLFTAGTSIHEFNQALASKFNMDDTVANFLLDTQVVKALTSKAVVKKQRVMGSISHTFREILGVALVVYSHDQIKKYQTFSTSVQGIIYVFSGAMFGVATGTILPQTYYYEGHELVENIAELKQTALLSSPGTLLNAASPLPYYSEDRSINSKIQNIISGQTPELSKTEVAQIKRKLQSYPSRRLLVPGMYLVLIIGAPLHGASDASRILLTKSYSMNANLTIAIAQFIFSTFGNGASEARNAYLDMRQKLEEFDKITAFLQARKT